MSYKFYVFLLIAVFAKITLAQPILDSKLTEPQVLKTQRDSLDYTPEQMMQKLVQFAEGSIPTRAQVEQDFGFEFKVGWVEKEGTEHLGQAPYPFAVVSSPKSYNVRYSDYRSNKSIVLIFSNSSKFCIRALYFLKAISSKWESNIMQYNHLSIRVIYWASFEDGITRELEIDPNHTNGDTCLGSFSIRYSSKINEVGNKK